MILLVTGCPCSGKTSVCRELEKRGFEYIGVDQFFGPGEDKYSPAKSEAAYRRMFASLGDGDYVVDAPGNAPEFLRQKRGLPYYTTVKLEAPWGIIAERYRSRWQANDIPPWKLKEEYEDAMRLGADIVVDTSALSPSEAAQLIMQRLEALEHGSDAIGRVLW